MNTYTNNPCFRCGKERIVTKTWKEIVITSSGNQQEVTYEEAVCPDAECQAILNEEFAKQKEKRKKINQEREQRLQEKKNNRLIKKNTPSSLVH